MQNKPELSRRRHRRHHLLLLFFLAVVALCCHTAFCDDTGAAPVSDVASAGTTRPPFSLPSGASLLDVLATASPASPLTAQPLLLLFTDSTVRDATTTALQAKVAQLAEDMPASVLRVHTYDVPTSVTERRLVDLVLNGVSTRLPALVLFHSSVRKAQIAPGTFVSSSPFFAPLPYPAADGLASVTYAELRRWVLSEMPARYVDPVTYHLIPSLQFVFTPVEALETVRAVRRAVDREASRSALPAVVTLAHVRLTTRGSEEVVAALSALAAQAGNAALTLVTESEEVAAAWGLTRHHTLSTAAWASVEAAYERAANETGAAQKVGAVVVPDASPAQSIATLAEAVTATAASTAWRAAADSTLASTTTTLRTWRRAMDAFNTTSPLRKIDSAPHFLHELDALQQAIKVVFVLRESDELWFHHHLDVAVKLAGRLQQTSVLYNTTTLAKYSKVPSRVLRSWTPSLRVEVLWLDAEQLPELADSLYVSQVPSVLVLAPLQSRFEDAGAGDDRQKAAAEEEEARAGLRGGDPLIGVHTVNRYDLNTAALINDATAAVDPPTGKDALPLYPADSDALVRFLASQSFLGAVQHALHPVRMSVLHAALLGSEATTASTGTGAVGGEEGGRATAVASTLPNRRYAQLDHRYYPRRQDEEPMEGPAYVRQILSGASPLPEVKEEVKAEEATSHRERQSAAALAKAAAKKKAAWEAELAQRKRDREARMRLKAADDSAARAKEAAAFQQSVEAAVRAEEKEGEKAKTEGGVGSGSGPRSPAARGDVGGVLVRRPPRETAAEQLPPSRLHPTHRAVDVEDAEDAAQQVRRRRRHAEYLEWKADRARMVEGCVSMKDGRELTLRFKWN